MNDMGMAPISSDTMTRNYGTAFEHDVQLQYLRRILESEPCISAYHSEPEVRKILAERHGIQSEKDPRYKVPDAMFSLQLRDRTLRVALELELSVKSIKRTRRMMELLGTSSDFDSTFFVVGSDRLVARLVHTLGDIRKTNHRMKQQSKDHGFYFVSLPALLSKKRGATFAGEGTTFTLRQLSEAAIK